MGTYIIGDIIRRTRESLGISSKELCEGICAIETLYRIENGERIPSRANFQALMERMGKPGEKYLPFVHSDEVDLIVKEKALSLLLLSRKFEEAENQLLYLKYKLNMEDNVNKQLMQRLQAIVDYETGKINEKEKRKILIDALLCTIPSYEEGTIPRGLFTRTEIKLLCNIAVSYAQEKNFDTALSMFMQIEKYFDTTSIDMEERGVSETLALSNYAQCLGEAGNIEEAIQKGKKAINISVQMRKCGILPNLLYNLACESMKLNIENKVYKKCFMQAYYVAELTDNTASLNRIKERMSGMSISRYHSYNATPNDLVRYRSF